MRFVLKENEWVLDFLNTAEWYFVYELPKLASGEGFSEDVRKSLFPSPIVDAEGNPIQTEDTEDWNEFVLPDIEDGFAKDRAVVSLDVDGAEQTDDPASWFDEDDEIPENLPEGSLWRITVDVDHTEQWYSTLNQTRIMLNKAHNLAEDDSRLLSIFGIESELPPEKALLVAQYEFYCIIQNILVENVMN
jgi:hypothetical protein